MVVVKQIVFFIVIDQTILNQTLLLNFLVQLGQLIQLRKQIIVVEQIVTDGINLRLPSLLRFRFLQFRTWSRLSLVLSLVLDSRFVLSISLSSRF
jgi:hypothetical protein